MTVSQTAQAMVEILYDHMDAGRQQIDNPTFGLTWQFGSMRLSNGCEDNVLTIRDYDLRRANSKRAVTAHFVRTILRGAHPMPRIPFAFLHFWAPPFNLKGVLIQHHFHSYRIGSREDYWHVVDGQGELL